MSLNTPKQQRRLQAATNMALAEANENKRQINTLRKKNKNKKKNKSGSARPGPVPIRALMPRTNLQPCSLHYASALCDPAGTPAGVCLPYGFPTESQRVKTFIRGTFVLGTTGQGFCIFNLPNVNDSGGVVHTTATSVGTTATVLGSFTNTVTDLAVKLPYTAAQIGASPAQVSARYVAASLRIRYTGTEANRRGTVCSLEEPQHKNMGALTSAQITQYVQSKIERPPPDGSWHSVNWSGPVNANEVGFVNTNQFVGTNISPMGFVIDGGNNDPYEYQADFHIEYAGSLPPEQMPGHSDADGYSKIVTATKTSTVNEPLSEKNAKSTFSSVLNSAATALKNYGPMILDIVSKRFLPTQVVSRVSPGLMQPGKPMLLGY